MFKLKFDLSNGKKSKFEKIYNNIFFIKKLQCHFSKLDYLDLLKSYFGKKNIGEFFWII